MITSKPTAFLKISKNGSQSIRNAFRRNGIDCVYYPTENRQQIWMLTLCNIFKEFDLSALLEHYCFATVRNPLDRFFSGWRMIISRKWVDPDCSPMDLMDMIYRGDQLDGRVYVHAAALQCEWLFIEGQFVCDNIIRFENLGHDARIVLNEIGLSDLAIGHCNKNIVEKTNSYYLLKYPHLLELHKKHFAEDWAKLPYSAP